MTTDEMLTELEQIGARLADVEGLYQRRLELMAALRQVDPPVTVARLAAVAQITDGAATQVLRQARQRGLL